MANILVTGASGQLGSELKELENSYPQHRFRFATRTDLDISDNSAVMALFANFQPHYCINCAAYTAVDKAETDKASAFAINATGVRNLAAASQHHQSKLIHISTDYVFDGTSSVPYTETDTTNPMGVYGSSKLQGEEEAFHVNKEMIVIRTSWVYSVYGNNFVKTMLRLMQSKPGINVVADQFGSPTYAADLANAIMEIINGEKWEHGIYHYSNEGVISWFDFAVAIKKHIQSPCIVTPISTEQYPTPAKRPKYSVLDKQKIVKTFNTRLLYWEDSLKRCLDKMSKESSLNS